MITLQRLRQKDKKFEASWNYIGKLCQRIRTQQNEKVFISHPHPSENPAITLLKKIEYVHSCKTL